MFCIINTIFIVVFRLIWNLEEDVDSEGVSVAAIMSYMNDATASENHLGRYIKWIFPNAKQKRKQILEAGRKFQRVYYQGLKWTDWTQTTEASVGTFCFPEYISVLKATENEYVLSHPTQHLRNGEVVNIYIQVKKEGKLELTCLNKQVDLGELRMSSKIGWSQKDFNKLFVLIQFLQLCTGSDTTPNTNDINTSHWSKLADENGRYRQHSANCRCIIHANTQSCCVICKRANRRARRPAEPLTSQERPDQPSTSQQEVMSQQLAAPQVDMNEAMTRVSMESLTETEDPESEEQGIQDDDMNDTIEIVPEDHQDMLLILHKVFPTAPENLTELLVAQMKNLKAKPNGRRWSSKVIAVCLRLWCRSPKGYEGLRLSPENEAGFLILPSTRLLQYYKNIVQQRPGVNEENIKWMRSEALKQGVPDAGWHGGVSIDEMQVQDDLQIVKRGSGWHLVGFVDMGDLGNKLEKFNRSGLPLATHSLQYVFAGFTGFRWPVAFYASRTATSHQLYVTFLEVLEALLLAGFTVDYLSMDGASTNRAFTNLLFPGPPRDQEFLAVNVFNLDHSYAVLQDIKHCLKKIRNSLEASRECNLAKGRYLKVDGQPVLWEFWEKAFLFNSKYGLRLHNKLTKDHIYLTNTLKMRNHLAEQVLSRDMLSLMKAYRLSLDEPRHLDSAVKLLEQTSLLVTIFTDCRRPIHNLTDNRLQTIRDIVKFFDG